MTNQNRTEQAGEPVAEICIGVSTTGQEATICIMQPHNDGTTTVIYSQTHPLGDSMGRASLASAPVAGKTREAVDYVRGGALNFDAHPDGAPVADELAAVDPCGYVAVKVSAVDWLKDKFPALTIKAGLCERIGGRLYTITRLMRDHDAALASAPVAGEAVAAMLRNRRHLGSGDNGKQFYSDFSEWFPATVGHARAVTSPNRNELGTWEVRWLVDAAPQASEVDVIEEIAKQWDGCIYDAGPGGDIDIGQAIRGAANKRS